MLEIGLGRDEAGVGVEVGVGLELGLGRFGVGNAVGESWVLGWKGL